MISFQTFSFQCFCHLKKKLSQRLKFLPPVHWNLKQGRKSKIFVLISLGMAFFVYLTAVVFPIYTVNSTPSCPRGVYLNIPVWFLSKNDYVTVTCPKTYAPLAVEGQVLIKRVKAMPGDTYRVLPNNMEIGKEIFPIYQLEYLPQLDVGTYTVPDGCYLFLNDMPYSFDSRYMGPISGDHILHKEILLINLDFFKAMYLRLTGGNADETYTFSNYFSHM